MNSPILLDLFCGAGGAARGYVKAGYEVVGVDIAPQKNYPYEFHQADALEFIARHGHEFDIIHASPVCKGYSGARWTAADNRKDHPLQIADVRAALLATGKPYVIENVKGARPHLIDPIELCGCMFGLNTYRARLFETSHPIAQPRHPKHTETLLPAGRGKKEGSSRFSLTSGGIKGVSQLERFAGMGYNEICMTNAELNESIPPAFSEYIGLQLMHAVTYREL